MCLQLPFTKRLGKAKGARMNNPGTLETLGTTQNKGKQNKKQPYRKLKKTITLGLTHVLTKCM